MKGKKYIYFTISKTHNKVKTFINFRQSFKLRTPHNFQNVIKKRNKIINRYKIYFFYLKIIRKIFEHTVRMLFSSTVFCMADNKIKIGCRTYILTINEFKL